VLKRRKNKIQVYGLPRSGTNFVEWSLKNNFVDLEYNNYYSKPEIKSIPRTKVAIKHNFPSLDNSEFSIVIYKEWESFSLSYSRWAKKEIEKSIYDLYLKKAHELDKDKTIIFEHSWLCLNYRSGMEMISEKFGIKLKEKINQPENVLNKAGANSKQMKNKFILK